MMRAYRGNVRHHSSFSTLPYGRLLCGHRACPSRTLYGCLYCITKTLALHSINGTVFDEYFRWLKMVVARERHKPGHKKGDKNYDTMKTQNLKGG